jgi:hypothetical protein
MSKKMFDDPSEKTYTFEAFLGKKFKGLKPVRKIITEAWIRSIKKKNANPHVNYCKIAGVTAISSGTALNSVWTTYFFPSDLKTFLFKLHHSIIGINSRIHHFNVDRDPSCTFCIKNKNFPAERETFQHFFWDCPTSNYVINRFSDMYTRVDENKKKEIYFTGIVRDGNKDDFVLPVFLVCCIIKYTLWNFKLKHKLPGWYSLFSQ